MRSNTRASRPLALWAIIALVVSGPMLFGNHLQGSRPYPAAYPLTLAALSGVYWTVAALLLVPLLARFPISRRRWAPSLLHIPGLVIGARGHVLLFGFVTRAFGLGGDSRLGHAATEYATGIGIQLYVMTVALISVLQSQARAQQAEIARQEAQRLSEGARSLALRLQLNAHFLFNTLNTVAMAIRRSDEKQALSIVVSLATLLRTVLRQSATELVSLKDEMDFVARYLEIEQVRFSDRLHVEWLVTDEAQRAAVPALILQPVVENALRHGIEKRSDAGELRIEASRAGDSLHITIDDDGPGFEPSWAAGVGLSNVRDRLQIHFADRASVAVDGTGRGGSVRLSLPFSEVVSNA